MNGCIEIISLITKVKCCLRLRVKLRVMAERGGEVQAWILASSTLPTSDAKKQ